MEQTGSIVIAGRVEEVIVTHVEDPVTFWAQSGDRSHEILKIYEHLARFCPPQGAVRGNPEIGDIYGGRFSEDNCWYRCRLQKIINDDEWLVMYLDYGNSEVLKLSNVVSLPDELKFASLATKYKLWNLITPETDIQIYKQGIIFLKDMILEKRIILLHKLTCEDGVVVQANCCNLDVGEEVVKKGFAFRIKSVPNAINNDCGKTYTCMKAQIQTPLLNNYVEEPLADYQKTHANLNMMQSPGNIQKGFLKKTKNNPADNSKLVMSPVLTASTNIVTNSELILLEENKKLKYHTELLERKCQSLESHITLLRLEVEKEKQTVLETYQDLEQCRQTAVGDRLGNVCTKIEFLKAARSDIMNYYCDDNLITALRVVTEDYVAKPSSMEKLAELWKEYTVAQQEIEFCRNSCIVHDLIGKRNQLQQCLSSQVNTFLLEVEGLPLDERIKSLQQLSHSLRTVYGDDPKVDTSDNIFDEFYEWSCAKIAKVRVVQNTTDESLQTLILWFNSFRSIFDLSLSVCFKHDVGIIDELVKKVESDIEEELNILISEQNETEKKIIICTYSKLMALIQQEEELIKVMTSKRAESLEFRKQMCECLHESPNVDQLLAVKKKLKELKTELMWQSVEKRCLEESDKVIESDVASKKENIVNLREKIFEEIYREQNEYKKLSHLVKKWLPELPLLYPEAEILKYMNSGGLLSVSLDRELLDAKPVKELSSKRPIICANILGQAVLLKGFTVGVETEPKMIARAANYHTAWSNLKEESGLLPLLFLFFSKSDPLSYVMVPFYRGESLGELQVNKPLTAEEIPFIMKGVACGLKTIHEANIVHGSVHQNNSFAVNRKKGILGDFDFTKTVEERGRSNSFGLFNFTAPEVREGQPASPSSDMYAYGCLLFWLAHGEYFEIKSGGNLDVKHLCISTKLKSLLSGLLCSADRTTAESVIEDQYFQV